MGLAEILTEVLPQIGADASTWNPKLDNDEGGDIDEF
jgi:hypothetical protein